MAAVGSRAVIVEDHDALSRGLELVLGKAGIDVVGSARTEQEGYEIILRERPGLAVVDIGLEDGSGVELARRLAESEPDLGVLIYTGLDDEGLLREAIDSGARGFALKAGPRPRPGRRGPCGRGRRQLRRPPSHLRPRRERHRRGSHALTARAGGDGGAGRGVEGAARWPSGSASPPTPCAPTWRTRCRSSTRARAYMPSPSPSSTD